ncbi:TPA: hydrogenase accessory protein HypB [Candidatus Poribacteria bacterium]|nr:hydrogenase accessory protein HypB [Candidatus Poribacteria bacterium]
MKVSIVENILKANDRIAEQNRNFFKSKGVLTINVMSGPGTGKTSLIEKTINDMSDNINIAVIEGDIQTTYDADRIAKTGAQVVQINTGGACHLDANMISQSLNQIDLDCVDLLIIENVGNLVCPAEFKLGEDFNIALLSITEGDDKPFKYPLIFNVSHLLLINKIDLLPYIDCDIKKIKDGALRINSDLEVLEISCKTGEGLDKWYDWLLKKLENFKKTKK